MFEFLQRKKLTAQEVGAALKEFTAISDFRDIHFKNAPDIKLAPIAYVIWEVERDNLYRSMCKARTKYEGMLEKFKRQSLK